MNAININKLSKSFGDKVVLDEINLSVEQGEFLGLVGMNGSGKSTMIKCLLDLVSIDNGDIEIFGKPHRQVSSRKNISYLPDRFSPPPYLKGKDFIDYMLELHGCNSENDKINAMMDALELDREAVQASVNRLSKGMTQKLGLASCLLSGKSLLVLDEPMSGLDPKARVLFKKKLQDMKRDRVTLFFSSHVLADVDELADRIAVLHRSKILYIGTSEEFKSKYNADTLEDAYMLCIDSSQAA